MKKQNKIMLVLLSLFFIGLASSDVAAMKRKRCDDEDDKNPKKSKIRKIENDSDSESESDDEMTGEDSRSRAEQHGYKIPQRRPAPYAPLTFLDDENDQEDQQENQIGECDDEEIEEICEEKKRGEEIESDGEERVDEEIERYGEREIETTNFNDPFDYNSDFLPTPFQNPMTKLASKFFSEKSQEPFAPRKPRPMESPFKKRTPQQPQQSFPQNFFEQHRNEPREFFEIPIHQPQNYHRLHIFLAQTSEQMYEVLQFAAKQGDMKWIELTLDLFRDAYATASFSIGQPDRYRIYNEQNLYGKVLEIAAVNGHEAIAILFARKLKGNLACTCDSLNIIKKTTNTIIRKKLIDLMKKDSKKPLQFKSLFSIASQIDDLKLMKYAEKKYIKKIPKKSVINALQRALENQSDTIVEYLTRKMEKSYSTSARTAANLLKLAAKKNYLRIIEFLRKSTTVNNSTIPKLAPELLIIAAKHGNFKIVRYLLESVEPKHNYNAPLEKETIESKRLYSYRTDPTKIKKGVSSTYYWILHAPAALETAMLIASEKGSQAKTKEEKKKYEKIVSYLINNNKETQDVISFINQAATKQFEESSEEEGVDDDEIMK